MFEVGDFCCSDHNIRWNPNAHLILKIFRAPSNSRYSKSKLVCITFAGCSDTKSEILSVRGKSDGNWWHLEDIQPYLREVTIHDIIKCTKFNEEHYPEFKVFFRKLVNKELSNESPK